MLLLQESSLSPKSLKMTWLLLPRHTGSLPPIVTLAAASRDLASEAHLWIGRKSIRHRSKPQPTEVVKKN
jgi:hypothetical protein